MRYLKRFGILAQQGMIEQSICQKHIPNRFPPLTPYQAATLKYSRTMEHMTLREAAQTVPGMRYVLEHLPVHSGPGQKAKGNVRYMRQPDAIERSLNELDAATHHLANGKTSLRRDLLEMVLCQIQDVGGSVENLKAQRIRDDIELFEIKSFALHATKLRGMIEEVQFPTRPIPNLEQTLDLLDPQRRRIAEFYVYDDYSPELADARRALQALQQRGAAEEQIEQQRLACITIEDGVRRSLVRHLAPQADTLAEAIAAVGHLDLLIGRAALAEELGLSRPQLSQGGTSYKGLFHPEVQAVLAQGGRRFQPIDIAIHSGPTLITGANMAGKSVLLQSLALAQHMAQFGLYVPAEKAEIEPVDLVLTSIGDGQDRLGGLSSFGAEMMRLHAMVQQLREGAHPLILLDELARTTNPTEGRAIVQGVLTTLAQNNALSVITTHYGGISVPCRRLKVRGFRDDLVKGALGIDRLNAYIDYSLEEDAQGEVPHEALRIAELMGVDETLLSACRTFLRGEQ